MPEAQDFNPFEATGDLANAPLEARVQLLQALMARKGGNIQNLQELYKYVNPQIYPQGTTTMPGAPYIPQIPAGALLPGGVRG